MGHRWFNALIVVFWLSTMTWLLLAKVLPPLRVGDPPSYQSIYASISEKPDPPVCWDLLWNDRLIGYLITSINRSESGMTEVKSQIHFSHLPLEELVAAWMRPLLQQAIPPDYNPTLDADYRLQIDASGQLIALSSVIRPGGQHEACIISGKVEGPHLRISIESGLSNKPIERLLPANDLVYNELAPDSRLPGLSVGQSWTAKAFSPLRGNSGLEVLQAEVESSVSIKTGDQTHQALVVVYRSDSGSMFGASREPRSKLWVDEEGNVIKQVVYLLGKRLTFERAGDKRSQELLVEAEHREEELQDFKRQRHRRRMMRSDRDFTPMLDQFNEGQELDALPQNEDAESTGEGNPIYEMLEFGRRHLKAAEPTPATPPE
ncbi:MAG: hypothetical protein SGJ20_19025 [Planctomycetota bacterium]|nr:hypothetical protein [Planctomycetota bacterium]